MNLEKIFDQYFQWWQTAASRYLEFVQRQPQFLQAAGLSMEQSLRSKQTMDRLLDEMWRNLRLPPLEEVVRLHERLNFFESRLVAIEEKTRNRNQTVEAEEVQRKRNRNSLKRKKSRVRRGRPD
jgi:hypothetical protein